MNMTSVRVRMYNVGFGDAFLVNLEHDDGTWRMLIDCGVHNGGSSGHKMADVVDRIISDITVDGKPPHVDVVVASHRHRDHVSGFERAEWDAVTVGEVWMPFTENPRDRLGRSIKEEQARKAARLRLHLQRLAAAGVSEAKRALHITENEFSNAAAMQRLHSGFAGSPRRRFFPNSKQERKRFRVAGLDDVTVHMLGPFRDRAVIGAMDPPADQEWLQLAPNVENEIGVDGRLFAQPFVQTPAKIQRENPQLYIDDAERAALASEVGLDALAVAASLAKATNNTSLVFVLDVLGTKLLFPGDAQWGLWDAILADPDVEELLAQIRLYKVGHHGSHNASHKRLVQEIMSEDTVSLMPFHRVEDWPSIPNERLVAALEKGRRVLIRADEQTRRPRLHWDGSLVAEYSIALRA